MTKIELIKQELEEIQDEIRFVITMMREAGNTPDSTWQEWSDRHYELTQDKSRLQAELLKVGKANIKARA